MEKKLAPWYSARDEIVGFLEQELMGPAELTALDEPPLNRIIVGVLHPLPAGGGERYLQGLEEGNALDANVGTTGETGEFDSGVALSRSMKPSSIGMTFTVSAVDTPRVVVEVSSRRYTVDEHKRWHPTDVQTPAGFSIDPRTPGPVSHILDEEPLRIAGVVRQAIDGMVRITLSIVNTQKVRKGEQTDGACWFRPTITASIDSGRFIDRKRIRATPSHDEDVRSNDFLYRHEPVLAIGHGCAVTWEDSGERVTELRTTFIPRHDLPLASPSGGDELDVFGSYELSMEALAASGDTTQLHAMVDAYEQWIAKKQTEVADLPEIHRSQAMTHLKSASECADRIRSGIEVLEDASDPDTLRAFRLMNEAMMEQRRAQDRARGISPGTQHWRPFQIAFILINLPALTDEAHPDREIVDLLWFPTGGGKTEAYLGCIAYSILRRRLRRPDDGGVSAIMRYTLRLLTRQQFERAAGLICALELIRRREMPSATEITLGLWVGDKASPNKVEDAGAILNKIENGQDPEGSTPVQLLNCPWCGSTMDHRNYTVIDKARLEIRCLRPSCEFENGLPLVVTDDDVYRVRPSLLIGTVDKFAMMTWRDQVGALLSVDGPDSRPDLIVQDELHLISGPLGTMVGLYEAALDLACTGDGRPKVLASTATIRRAQTQIRSVFDRDSRQFPPPGLDPSDNYFAVEATPDAKGTRRYLGILAPGTSQATLLVRIYSALLQAVERLETSDEVKDDYWTLLGYFNSLRVLGSTYLQVLDDVPERIKNLANRLTDSPRTISQEPVELTSRVAQTKIPTAMKLLETSYPDPRSPDIVLATNMISVGLDIDRLGLMVVAGQPQNTSEYIQSTSRVGRRNPGLVVVALNSQRSRDTSHYESFIPFHRALYREVEATTATPFASRARDRGAHGAFVAAARLSVPGLRGDGSAAHVAKYQDRMREIIQALVDRARRVSPDEAEAFKGQLEELLDTWSEATASGLADRYGNLRHPSSRSAPTGHPLLTSTGGEYSQPGSFPVGEPPWPTLSSMRDVDAETALFVKYLKGNR